MVVDHNDLVRALRHFPAEGLDVFPHQVFVVVGNDDDGCAAHPEAALCAEPFHFPFDQRAVFPVRAIGMRLFHTEISLVDVAVAVQDAEHVIQFGVMGVDLQPLRDRVAFRLKIALRLTDRGG